MTSHPIYTMSFASVYPHYVAKAEKKGRTKKEVDEIICWLTGYTGNELRALLKTDTDFKTFFKKSPHLNPYRKKITGVVCGIRVEDIKKPLMREIRYLDKLIDELAKGKAMEKILRSDPVAENADGHRAIKAYNASQTPSDKKICSALMKLIDEHLPTPESKIWHRHPVWFLNGNPIVGYSKLKDGVRLMFWSGAGFDEKDLQPGTGKFKDASIRYTSANQIDEKNMKRWLKKAKKIQWDYKHIQKRKGKLVRIKP